MANCMQRMVKLALPSLINNLEDMMIFCDITLKRLRYSVFGFLHNSIYICHSMLFSPLTNRSVETRGPDNFKMFRILLQKVVDITIAADFLAVTSLAYLLCVHCSEINIFLKLLFCL